jgi:putative transposase
LVFTTKYRRGPFTDEILTRCEQVMHDVCADFDAELTEFNGETDHVHLLVRYPPAVALSRLVNSLKGVSSRRLRQEFPDHIRRYLWGNHFWSPSYFAASCGGAPLDIVKQYIDQQRRPD